MEKTELNKKMFELLNKYHKTGNETNEIKSLIEQGAEVNARDKESGATPLMYACGSYDYDKLGNGNIQLARFLITKGAEVNAKDPSGNTALTNSALIGNVEIAKLLISKGANVNTQDRNNATPLMATQIALGEQQQNAVQVAKILIENGADVNMRDNSGKTALDYQKSKVDDKYKNDEMIQLLKDTSTNELFEMIEPYLCNEECRNAILGHIKEYLANGADINCVKDCQIEHIDKENGNIGYETLYGAYNLKTATPLMIAVNAKEYNLSKFLIENGADVNIKNKEGETALMVATKWGDLETTKLLIDKGANVNAKDKEGKTALDIAIESPYSSKLKENEQIKDNENLKNLIISKGGKKGIEIKPKVKAKAKTKQKSNDFEMGM